MNLPKSPFPFIFHFMRRQALSFFATILIAVIWATNDAFFPYFLKRIIDDIQNYHGAKSGIYSAISGVLILLILFWLVTEICLRLQGIFMLYMFPRFRANVREAVFGYVTAHSHEYFSNNFAGTIAKKLADLPTSCQSIMEIICFNFITTLTGAIIVLIMMWQTKPFFAYVLLIWLAMHLGLVFLFLRRGNLLAKIHADSVSVLSGKIVDVFANISNVRLFARAPYESDYLKTFQQDEIKKAVKSSWLIEISRVGLGISGLFLIFAMLYLLLHGWVNGWVTIGDFTQVSMQTFWLLGWVWFVSFQISIFAREMGTVTDALTLISKKHDVVNVPNATDLKVSKGEIAFEHVTFAYQQNRPVFHDLDITITAGQKVGLVGFSGSGKSTFVNLILRYFDLQSGRILIDGQDIAKAKQDSLRSQIAMIPQDPSLFHRSLMENIRYGRLDASDAEVVSASRLAHCHEFIEKLDENYHAMVGERGIKLSGGQRQRISIARAILKNAPILILDEATSALDTVTEKLIQESLQLLMKNRTAIVVAHRLSTLADMDRILVFHKGKIIEDGTTESLLNVDGHFAKLWNMQMDGFLPDEGEGE